MDLGQIFSLILDQIVNKGFPKNFISSNGFIFNFLVPLVVFGYAVKILFDQIGLFHKSKFTHMLLGLLISLAALVLLPSLNIFFASLAIFIIFMFELHGMKGVLTGIISGVIFFLAYPLALKFLWI